jgi:hypothetical protein
MKRFLEIVIFSFVTMGLLTSVTTEKESGSIIHRNSLPEIKHDTTGFISFIKTDSFNLSIYPPSSGVQFYRDGIVFLASSKNEGKMLPTHISFGSNIAYYAIAEDSIVGKPMIFSPSSSFTYPCEAVTFNSDFSTMYFTKLPKKGNKEKIFLAKNTSQSINKPGWLPEKTPMDFCTDNSTYSHPSLSSDEKTMIFASDKEGSLGGMDLFITKKDGDKWSAPENLGSSINTPGNEFYPFLDSANNLYYSSDGLPGYGGYDIFTCRFNGESWEKPINMSKRINSENDDIAFTINKSDGKSAFYTTRQKSGEGGLQLFRVTLNKEAFNGNLLTISYIFHGKPVEKPVFIAAKPAVQAKPVEVVPVKVEPKAEVIKKDSAVIPVEKKVLPEVKKEEVKVVEIPVKREPLPETKPVIVPETKVKPPEAKVVIIKPSIPVPVEQKDVVIYRIQFLSSAKPQKDNQIIVNGQSYKTYEYFYLGEYRYTVGEFTTLPPAAELQSAVRQSGYPQAFVAAFKNNTRSLDLKLFK